MYNNVKQVEGNVKQEKSRFVCFTKKQQSFFGVLFVFIVTFNIFNVGLYATGIGGFAKRIISSYYSGEQIGKIKYVDTIEGSGANMVFSFFDIDYMLPFKNGVVSKGEDGTLIINGGSDCLVVCPYKSTVKEIINDNLKKTIILDCGFNVCMHLGNLDNVGVKEGQVLNKGDKIGLCFDSIIKAKITYKNKVYDKIKVSDGKISL